MAKFVCRAENKHLLKAMMEELESLGITNQSMKDQRLEERATTIIVYPDNTAAFHNHTGSRNNTIYDLPAQWDEAIEAAKCEYDIKIGDYKAVFAEGKVHFGCQTLTRQDLLSYRHLLSDPIGATINIKGTDIDIPLIDELMKRMPGSKKYSGVWEIGDRLTSKLLSEPATRRWYGYENAWETKTGNAFFRDRKIDDIKYIDGVWAGLVSESLNIWVALDDL